MWMGSKNTNLFERRVNEKKVGIKGGPGVTVQKRSNIGKYFSRLSHVGIQELL